MWRWRCKKRCTGVGADPALARVVEAWPRLPAAVRRKILELADRAGT
jgi:hypothetical protein